MAKQLGDLGNITPPAVDADVLWVRQSGVDLKATWEQLQDSIREATDVLKGLMSAADKATFDAATADLIPDSLMKRDASGRAKVEPPADYDDIARMDSAWSWSDSGGGFRRFMFDVTSDQTSVLLTSMPAGPAAARSSLMALMGLSAHITDSGSSYLRYLRMLAIQGTNGGSGWATPTQSVIDTGGGSVTVSLTYNAGTEMFDVFASVAGAVERRYAGWIDAGLIINPNP